ncbi:Uncharacterized protein Adt_20519 [Abeliophyllum distichum]|uniref:Uncharacterized protein n=1 Tax=Abeliophyllum distichum TaxID=126358 RepID=A0ABD1SWU6_9LAMI
MSQRNNAGNDWPYRRMGFHGRNQSAGAKKGGLGSKMKFVSGQPEQSYGNLHRELGSVLAEDSSEGDFLSHSISSEVSGACNNKIKLESGSRSEEKVQRDSVSNNYLSSSKENGSASQLQRVQPSSKYVSVEKNFNRPIFHGPLGGSRGRRYAYALLPKSLAPRQSVVVSTSPNKLSAPLARQLSTNSHSDFVASEGKSLGNKEVSSGNIEVSQPPAPIGTPALNTETPADTPSHILQTEYVSVVPNTRKDLKTEKMFESKNKVLDHFQSSASIWGTPGINQQVMALTQTHLRRLQSLHDMIHTFLLKAIPSLRNTPVTRVTLQDSASEGEAAASAIAVAAFSSDKIVALVVFLWCRGLHI